jgi:hypothetical protein
MTSSEVMMTAILRLSESTAALHMNDPSQALRELCQQTCQEARQSEVKDTPGSPVQKQAQRIAAEILKRKEEERMAG